jgi:putative oxidoreductase
MIKAQNIYFFLFAIPISLLLGHSALVHIENSYFFLSTIYSYQLVSRNVGLAIASVAPFLQLTLSLLLLFDSKSRKQTYLCCVLVFILYIGVQLSALFRDLNISCGCFGSNSDNPIGFTSLSIATTGLLLSLCGFFLTTHTESKS